MAKLIPPPAPMMPVSEAVSQVDWAEVFFSRVFLAKVLLSRFWWVILSTLSLGLSIQAYRALTSPPQYLSSAQMIVSGRMSLPDGTMYSEELSNFYGTQIALMNCAQVRERAAARVQSLRPELKPVPVNVNVRQGLNTSVFMFGAVGVEPEYTQAYLDAMMHEYLAFKRQMRSETADRTFMAINEEVIDLQNKIEQGENEKVDFQKQNNVVFIQQQGEQLGSYLTQVTQQLSAARTQLRFIESLKIDSLSNNEGETAAVNIELLGVGKDFLETKEKLNQLRAERDESITYMKPNHPRLAELSQEIEREENLLNIYRRQSLARLKEKQQSLVAQIENLESVIEQQQVYALDYSRRLAEFERVNSRLERQKKVLDQLLSSIQSINLNLNVDQESVSIMQDATLAMPAPSGLIKQLLVGAIMGIFIGSGIVILIGVIDGRIVSIEDISRRFEEPVMGIVPWQRGTDKRDALLRPNDTRIMLAEACRNVRSSLLYSEQAGERIRVFLITSAAPSEGKSTISGQLAATFAFTSAKVLFIDADLRRGRQHHVFEVDQSPGFSELLQGNATFDDVVKKTETKGLDFIPAGSFPDNPGELLTSPACNSFLAAARRRYDYVIFDTAPILASDDTSSFATKMDGVLFVVRSAFSRARHVQLSMQSLLLRQAKVCGFVLNGFDSRGPGYYYYKYRDYYSTPRTAPDAGGVVLPPADGASAGAKVPFASRVDRTPTSSPVRRRGNTRRLKGEEEGDDN